MKSDLSNRNGMSGRCGITRSPAMNVDSLNDDSFIQNNNLLGLGSSVDGKSMSAQNIS